MSIYFWDTLYIREHMTTFERRGTVLRSAELHAVRGGRRAPAAKTARRGGKNYSRLLSCTRRVTVAHSEDGTRPV